MLHLKQKYKIKSLKFLNEKNTSHYNIQPSPYKKIISRIIPWKRNTIFKKIIELIESKKDDRCINDRKKR